MSVFISHSSQDKAIAETIVHALERAQIACWIAPRNIRPGTPYADAIVEGVRSCKVFVVVVSQHAVQSEQVLREVERAVHYGADVLPFIIEKTRLRGSFEYFLSATHWLDASTRPLEPHIEHLTTSVRGMLAGTAPPPDATPITAIAEPPAVEEIPPDAWSDKPGGRLRRFFQDLLEDPQP